MSPLFEYVCPEGHVIEKFRTIKQRNDTLVCDCGLEAERRMSVVNNSFGWKWSDRFLDTKGCPEEFVRNI